jgi:GH24 family phage-related lysozyme (muramidase)
VTTTAEFIAGFEGYAGRAYWDVNHWRLGYGSDTEGPDQVSVTEGMETTKARALQNLALRIPQFQQDAVYGKTGMGADSWEKLNDNQRTAITSLVYNYGRLPIIVTPSDPQKTATAIRALQTANGGVNRDRRIKEAAFYLASVATAPQPAPPAPALQVPAPKVPPAVPHASPAPAGPPPISATAAGRRASVLDAIGAMRDALLQDRAAIDAEIAILDTTAADFGKLPGVTIALPLPLQKPEAANPAASVVPQGTKKMFGMTNWQTSLAGIVAGLAGIATQIPQLAPYAPTIGLISTFFIGIAAKDHNVTGGTVSNVTGAVGKPVSLVDRQ